MTTPVTRNPGPVEFVSWPTSPLRLGWYVCVIRRPGSCPCRRELATAVKRINDATTSYYFFASCSSSSTFAVCAPSFLENLLNPLSISLGVATSGVPGGRRWKLLSFGAVRGELLGRPRASELLRLCSVECVGAA